MQDITNMKPQQNEYQLIITGTEMFRLLSSPARGKQNVYQSHRQVKR